MTSGARRPAKCPPGELKRKCDEAGISTDRIGSKGLRASSLEEALTNDTASKKRRTVSR